MKQSAIGIIIICIILFISILVCENDELVGFYRAPETFLEDAEVQSMILYISKKINGKRDAHMIVTTCNEIVINKSFPIKITKNILSSKYDFECLEPINATYPTKLTMDFDKVSKRMKLIDGDTVYAVMYKDNELSDIKIEI
jgi:hypothetical protein